MSSDVRGSLKNAFTAMKRSALRFIGVVGFPSKWESSVHFEVASGILDENELTMRSISFSEKRCDPWYGAYTGKLAALRLWHLTNSCSKVGMPVTNTELRDLPDRYGFDHVWRCLELKVSYQVGINVRSYILQCSPSERKIPEAAVEDWVSQPQSQS
jgi:hypothetical protein